MNKLRQSSSPYLLQHSDNPVDWHPWDQGAWNIAKHEDKPVLVSIGYSTCHWCHVMEKESFQDPDIAAYMNKYFINIKVDREERPDLDQIYMEACQLITGETGWPLNIFLTPDKKPFYGGTYFPPNPSGKKMSWSQVLQFVHFNFKNNKSAVQAQARKVLDNLNKVELELDKKITNDVISKTAQALSEKIVNKLSTQWDNLNGGFGAAPKFPNISTLEFLLAHHYYTGDELCKNQVTLSIRSMLQGGIYDQIGGGIFRYAIDSKWRIPHFEKMLYDNAQWIGLLSQYYQVTKQEQYAHIIRECIDFVAEELMSDDGLFYSALDADSEGEEGKYYTWNKKEIRKMLGQESSWFCEYYGVSDEGNWENTNIIYQVYKINQFAEKRNWTTSDLIKKIKKAKSTLRRIRSGRFELQRDDKVILGWNAMMISGLIQAGNALSNPDYHELAAHSLSKIWELFVESADNYIRRVYYPEGTQLYATLSDLANLIRAILDYFMVNSEVMWLNRAQEMCTRVIQEYAGPSSPFFYQTHHLQTDSILRKRDVRDDDFPCGNVIMAQNLYDLGILLNIPEYVTQAQKMLEVMETKATKEPLTYSRWAREIIINAYGKPEIAIVGNQAFEHAHNLRQRYIPGLVMMNSIRSQDQYPLLKNRWKPDETWIYVCKNYTCQKPIQNLKDLQLIDHK